MEKECGMLGAVLCAFPGYLHCLNSSSDEEGAQIRMAHTFCHRREFGMISCRLREGRGSIKNVLGIFLQPSINPRKAICISLYLFEANEVLLSCSCNTPLSSCD